MISWVDVLYELNGCSFVWDSSTASVNLSKHGVAFEQAVEAFFDPFLKVIDGIDPAEREARDTILGMAENWSLLFVVHIALEDETFRVISARLATAHERKSYES